MPADCQTPGLKIARPKPPSCQRKAVDQITYLKPHTTIIVIAKNPSLPEEGQVPPKKQKASVAANSGLAFLEFIAILAATATGVGVGMYFDNAMASAFVAHVLAGVIVALMNEIGKKLKKSQ